MATKMDGTLIAIVDSAGIPAESYSSRLSVEENAAASAIASPKRREEWLAGRMAAKYVFLRRELSGASEQSEGLYLQKIGIAELAGFDSQVYRSVTITKDKAPGGGPARAGWCDSAESVHVAISHVNGLACAFIGGTAEIYAVDLEKPASRIPEFYIQNFTHRERNWAGTCARAFDLNSDWLYTVLWSAKECLLKTPQFAKLSLWNMPSIEINIVGGSERLKNVHDATDISETFEFLQADLAPSAAQIQLAVSGTADLILTAITRLD
jgi:4'-phosphopantetheinyl transferase EntD